jgi:ABC-type transport system involved in multi-copper enzyme maturation permease subunit
VTAVLFWKEYREHRSVWLTLMLVAVGTLVGLVQYFAPGGAETLSHGDITTVVVATLVMPGMYGVVCGSMMLAGERESRTILFLDTLPATRLGLWGGKAVIGLLFTLLYSLLVVGVAFGVGLHRIPGDLKAVWLLTLPAVGLEAYAWGLCGSALCRNVLTSVALAALLPLAVVWSFCAIIPAGDAPEGLAIVTGFRLVFAGAALFASAVCFTSQEYEKRFNLPITKKHGEAAPARPPQRWQAFLWLVFRQGLVEMLVVGALGVLLGLALPAAGPVLWLAATLLIGVVCGTAVFGGEQADGANKFLGDLRLPMGWFWSRKTAVWAAVAVLSAGLMLLGALIHVTLDAHRDDDFPRTAVALLDRLLGGSAEVTDPLGRVTFAVLWLPAGFAVGQLCSLVWKKRSVAVVVAVLAGAGAASVWLPSLIAGGLPPWAVVGVPLILLAACRLVMWPWVSERLPTRRPALTLVAGVLLSVVWMGVVFGHRVGQVRGGPEPFDVDAFRRVTPTAEQEESSKRLRAGLDELDRQAFQLERPADLRLANPHGTREQMLAQVLQQGWAARAPDLAAWLDGAFKGEWAGLLRQSADLPPGGLADPPGGAVVKIDVDRSRRAADLLVVRAVQLQAADRDAEALEPLVSALGLSRQMRQRAPAYAYRLGLDAERIALDGLDRWLEKVASRPDLVRRALAELTRHESLLPPVTDTLKVEYVAVRRGLGDPGLLPSPTGAVTPRLTSESLALISQVPWEQGRAERINRAVFAGRLRAAEASRIPDDLRGRQPSPPIEDWLLADWSPQQGSPAERQRLGGLLGSSWLRDYIPSTAEVQRESLIGLCRVRGLRLQAALSVYRARHGKPAADLESLVPELLPEVPTDPYDGAPYRYRVSEGERIAWARVVPGAKMDFAREVPAGSGIVWSIGPDGADGGGTRQWHWAVIGKADVVFVVP